MLLKHETAAEQPNDIRHGTELRRPLDIVAFQIQNTDLKVPQLKRSANSKLYQLKEQPTQRATNSKSNQLKEQPTERATNSKSN